MNLTFGLLTQRFKYEYVDGGKSSGFYSYPVNAWAKQHTSVTAQPQGDSILLKANIASGDTVPSCIVIPGTRRCSGYEPSIGYEAGAEAKLRKSGDRYVLEDISVYHHGGYQLQSWIGARCSLTTR